MIILSLSVALPDRVVGPDLFVDLVEEVDAVVGGAVQAGGAALQLGGHRAEEGGQGGPVSAGIIYIIRVTERVPKRHLFTLEEIYIVRVEEISSF